MATESIFFLKHLKNLRCSNSNTFRKRALIILFEYMKKRNSHDQVEIIACLIVRTRGGMMIRRYEIATLKIIWNEKLNSKTIVTAIRVKWMNFEIFHETSNDSRSRRIMEKVTHTLSTSWQANEWLDALFHVTNFEPIKIEII